MLDFDVTLLCLIHGLYILTSKNSEEVVLLKVLGL